MRKQSFKTIKLFIKFILLFQLYSNINFEAEATQNPITKSCDESDRACLNNPTPENKMVDSDLDRPKRPARLLPLRMILGKDKNKTEIEEMANKRFYGPAKSCEELLKIGYTRNGFYLVNGNATSNISHVEIVNCLFKHPNGTKEVQEKRLGPVPLKTKVTKLHERRSIIEILMDSIVKSTSEMDLERSKRPGRLLPFHLLFGKEKNETEDENVPKPFYGPPENCIELGKIGFTLNGYYLVSGSKISNSIEVVLCRFQLHPGANETAMETRLGVITLEQLQSSNKESKAILGRKIRPVRLLPPRRKIAKEENENPENKVRPLISNPANCNDIKMLGYTLNGYYLVNSTESAGRFGVHFCQFKLPPGADRTSREDTFGFINLLENEEKSLPTSTTPYAILGELYCNDTLGVCNGK